MLELISDGFRKAQDILQGKITIQEKHIEDAGKEIRLSLLEAGLDSMLSRSSTTT
jgi:signal recognition particle GTPase